MLKNFENFFKMCELYYNDTDMYMKPISLYNVLCKAMRRNSLNDLIPKAGENKVKIICDAFSAYKFGDNCYILNEKNNFYIMIDNIMFSLNDSVKTAYNKAKNIIENN